MTKRLARTAALLTPLLLTQAALADSVCEFPPPLPLKAYPVSVAASGRQEAPNRTRLSKEPLEEIRRAYESHGTAGDSYQERTDGDYRSFSVFQRQTACNQTRNVLALEISERIGDNPNVSHAFGALKSMVVMGMHSEEEYHDAEKRYGTALKAFFREVSAPDQSVADEGRLILERCKREEKQQRTQFATPSTSDRQQASDLRKKMQEMKARGDIAGMMQMAQQFQGATKGETANQAAGEMNRDLWPLWSQCLQDMHAAAFRTRLEYSAVKE